MQVTSPQCLNEYLCESRTVKIESQDGAKFVFKIRRVSMASWDPKNEWYAKLIGTDPKALNKRIMDEIVSPRVAVIREVLLDGILEPEVSTNRPKEKDSAVWVDDLMRSDFLVRDLYGQIAQFAFEGIAKVGAPDDGGPKVNS